MRIAVHVLTRLVLASAPFLAEAAVARAQSYAPEVNYHDPVQRVFAVELARVLAWRENLAGAGIAEVRYEVRCDENGSCVWMLRWLDAQGAPWREIPLFYAAPALTDGAGFYRKTAAQLLAHHWTGFAAGNGAANAAAAGAAAAAGDAAGAAGPAGAPEPAAQTLDTAFWDGLGQMGISRMTTVRAMIAEESAVNDLQDTAAAARMAGRLLACAVPGQASMLTLDSTLAARGAAWLALVEHAASAARTAAAADGAPADAGALAASRRRWAVVLWLARRQAQAMDEWREAGAPGAGAPGVSAPGATGATSATDATSATAATTAVATATAATDAATAAAQARDWWHFVLTPRAPREFYLEAARHDAPAWAAALLAAGAVAEGSARNMIACLPLVSHFELQSEHDYAPLVAGMASRPHEPIIARWMQAARRDWLRTLGDRVKKADLTKTAPAAPAASAAPAAPATAGASTSAGAAAGASAAAAAASITTTTASTAPAAPAAPAASIVPAAPIAPGAPVASAAPAAATTPAASAAAATAGDPVLAAAVADARIESERDTAAYPDAALSGFPSLAHLIALAYREGAGPLAPAASVTARDLLNFGWENTGVQLAARHDFLAACFPTPLLAANFRATATKALPELAVFFQQGSWDAALPAIDNPDRLQRIEAAGAPMLFAPGPVFGIALPPGAVYSPPRCGYMAIRGWLLRGQSAWALWGLAASTADAGALSRLLRRSHDEGGPLNDRHLLAALSNPGNAPNFRRLPDLDALRALLASRLPPAALPPPVRIHAWQTRPPPAPPPAPLDRAQSAERAFWETPGDDYLLHALKNYLEANAPGALARLHDQAIDLMDRPQNNIAAGAYRLLPAMLDLDEPAMTAVLARENALGFARYHPRLYPALALGRLAEIEEMQAAIARADPQNVFWVKMMPGLLSTWRALGTPRALAALRAFAAGNTFPIEYLWLFSRAARLTTGERIILFGGDAATGARAGVTAFLRGDRDAFDAAWKTIFPGGAENAAYNMEHILLWLLRHELFAIRPLSDAEAPDLRPAGWKPLPDQVAEAITKRLQPDPAGWRP
ncbi:MAG: hypothetical protein LBC18_10345 [Opitutaceae bacterium]|jgi:hypothetical protein|nr:hypothetical protein [Opitutaceae bacterium]